MVVVEREDEKKKEEKMSWTGEPGQIISQIYLERFLDLFFKDHISATKEVWRGKIKCTEMNFFMVNSFLGMTPSMC